MPPLSPARQLSWTAVSIGSANFQDYQEQGGIDNSRLAFEGSHQLIEPNTMEHLCPKAINHAERHLGSILGRIDVNTERALAERGIDDLYDSCRDRVHIRVIGHDGRESFLNLLAISFIWS